MSTATPQGGLPSAQRGAIGQGAACTRRGLEAASAAVVQANQAVAMLRETMGRQLLARTLGVGPNTVDRYVHGGKPGHKVERRIQAALDAWQEVAQIEAPEVVRAWFMGMKDALNDLSPAEAIAQDRGRDVIAVARAYVQRA